MAAGVPVVAADATALPETCAGAALLVPPEDHQGFAAALERAVGDETLRSEVVAKGRARAAELTWDRAARRLDALLARL
jgi:glycosyltransferase involved in cell wall biosynthesis